MSLAGRRVLAIRSKKKSESRTEQIKNEKSLFKYIRWNGLPQNDRENQNEDFSDDAEVLRQLQQLFSQQDNQQTHRNKENNILTHRIKYTLNTGTQSSPTYAKEIERYEQQQTKPFDPYEWNDPVEVCSFSFLLFIITISHIISFLSYPLFPSVYSQLC